MEGFLDCLLDFLGELLLWEKLDRHLRKKIPIPALRCIAVSLIYVLMIGAVAVVLLGIGKWIA